VSDTRPLETVDDVSNLFVFSTPNLRRTQTIRLHNPLTEHKSPADETQLDHSTSRRRLIKFCITILCRIICGRRNGFDRLSCRQKTTVNPFTAEHQANTLDCAIYWSKMSNLLIGCMNYTIYMVMRYKCLH